MPSGSGSTKLGAAKCVAARRGIRRSRWLAIASTLIWPPYLVFLPAIQATPAILQQRDQVAFSHVSQVSLPGDASALLRRCAMLLPGSSQMEKHRGPPSRAFGLCSTPSAYPAHRECFSTTTRDQAVPSAASVSL